MKVASAAHLVHERAETDMNAQQLIQVRGAALQQIERGIHRRVRAAARGVRLDRAAHEFPYDAQLGEQRVGLLRVPRKRVEEAAPYVLENLRRTTDSLTREQRRKQSAFRRASRMHAFGLRCVMDETPQAAAETRCMTERRSRMRGVEAEQTRACSGRAEDTASHGRMPAMTVMRRITATRLQHTAADVITQNNRRQEFATGHGPLRAGQRSECGRQHHRAGVIATTGVVEFQRVRRDAVDEGRIPRAEGL